MRDNMKPCQHTLSNDVIYKDVVVIGNGPSGLVTSFMLAGNVPYLKEIPDDLPIDEMLKARLSNLPPGQSLYETDLLELAEGLEGRSQNPIPLLMDNLLRPCADLGIQANSLIEWKYDVDKQIEHVVLGRGPPGGAWHSFPPDVRTLSPAGWLSLPPHASTAGDRLPARALADYYRRYVRACKLTRYFRSGVWVTSVRRSPRQARCVTGCPLNAAYCVSGYDISEGRPCRYLCRRVVVAAGAGDRPNRLPPPTQHHSIHSLADVQHALQAIHAQVGDPPPSVLIVGSGVSAADAVWLSLQAGLRVLHIHRTPADALARLPPQTYPDYCQVYKMMCDGASGKYKNYTSYPEHMIVDVTGPKDAPNPGTKQITSPKIVKLLNLVTNEISEVTVLIIGVFIGSKPDLFFLQTNFNLNCIDIESDCIKCKEKTNKIEDVKRQCFLKDHWHYLKSVLGQSIQSCKSRYLNYTEINGNTNSKCEIQNCNKRYEKCSCNNNLISKLENGVIKTCVEKDCKCDTAENEINRLNCQCEQANPYSNGIGFGIDPKRPVDGRGNPVAIDKSTHELLNAPKGIYALGPLTGDNFVRFIPGGALAIVAHIHKENKIIE